MEGLEYVKRTWADIHLDRLAHNVRALRGRMSPGCRLMGVIKADAYGHGDRYIARELARQGADWLGVSNLEEALRLREMGLTLPILIFGPTPEEYAPLLCNYKITQTVHSLAYARRLGRAAAGLEAPIGIHIKVDTGMSRLGFVLEESTFYRSLEEICETCDHPGLEAGGLFTHFASADEVEGDGEAFTRNQFALFLRSLEELEAKGIRFPIRHCCNSAGTIRFPEMHLDMVRPGVALYGLYPSPDSPDYVELCPVMDLYSTVTMVKEVPPGTQVSYGRTYTAPRSRVLATVPIGYADGFERELSGARMLVRGRYAVVVGRVCMDQLVLDVTDIPGVSEGDRVTVVGRDGEERLSFDELAELSHTVHYEKVCQLSRRVPRIYRDRGKKVGHMDYLLEKGDF